MKLADALRLSYKRKAYFLDADGQRLYADDVGLTTFEPAGPGSCIQVDVLQPWHDVEPKARKILLASDAWEPLDPKSPLLVLAEALDDWRDCPDEADEASPKG